MLLKKKRKKKLFKKMLSKYPGLLAMLLQDMQLAMRGGKKESTESTEKYQDTQIFRRLLHFFSTDTSDSTRMWKGCFFQ